MFPDLGKENLKRFMKTIIPKDKKPDFSTIGLTNEDLLKWSTKIGEYSQENKLSKEGNTYG